MKFQKKKIEQSNLRYFTSIYSSSLFWSLNFLKEICSTSSLMLLCFGISEGLVWISKVRKLKKAFHHFLKIYFGVFDDLVAPHEFIFQNPVSGIWFITSWDKKQKMVAYHHLSMLLYKLLGRYFSSSFFSCRQKKFFLKIITHA